MRLKVCATCGAPFEPKRARQTHCERHELRGRDGSSPTTRAQDPEYAAERRRVLVPGAVCQWCGARATTADHVIPVARGGGHVGNIVAACASCNSSRQANEDWQPRAGVPGARDAPRPPSDTPTLLRLA